MRALVKTGLLRALAAAAAVLLLGPVVAHASSTVTLSIGPRGGGGYEVLGDAGANNVALSSAAGPDRLIFTEPGISTTVPTCTDSGDSISCFYTSAVGFKMGDGDDSVTADGSISPLASVSVAGEVGADRIAMGPEFDQIDGGPGADVMSGGAGFDRAYYGFTPRTTPVFAAIDGAARSGNELDGLPGAGDTIVPDIEMLVGGSADDTLLGGSAADDLYGGRGDDRLLGGAGNDILRGEGGSDRLLGGTGLDKLLAKDKRRDKVLDCGPGKNSGEQAGRDPVDPRARSC